MSLYMENLMVQGQSDKHRILDGIGAKLPTGTLTLLVGRTGSGKSTLLRLLAGLQAPDQGLIRYECGNQGNGVLWRKDQPDPMLLRRVGYVFQYPEAQLFASTVEAELLYSLRPYGLTPSEQMKRIQESLASWGLGEEFLHRSPFTLSGGEKRRVALAGVQACRPDWLLLDEPSSALDAGDSEHLADWLRTAGMERQSLGNGGIIVATHDLDLFLPIADQVLLLRDGQLLGRYTPHELVEKPELLVRAGVGVPILVRMERLSRKSPDPSLSNGGAAGLANPEQWAERLLQHRRCFETQEYSPLAETTDKPNRPAPPAAEQSSWMERLDPRMKWLIYVLFSFGIFYRGGWGTAVMGSLLLLMLGLYAGLPIAKWTGPARAFAWFMLLSAAISGMQLSVAVSPFSLKGTTFNWGDARETLHRLAPLLPALASGSLFLASTSPLAMQRGLSSMLQTIPGFSRGAETLSFAASLMFRFMRIIAVEWERFALLASVRGKQGGRPGKMKLRQLPSFFIPFLISILQHAEDLSTALESRGYRRGNRGIPRTQAVQLKLNRRDYAACMLGILAFVLLLLAGWILG